MANYIYGASILENGKEDEAAVAELFLNWLLNNEKSLKAFNTNAFPCFTACLLYTSYQADEKLQPMVAEISWTKNLVIMEKCKEDLEREFYIRMTKRYGLSLIHI